MAPGLDDGDFALARRLAPGQTPRIGDVVLVSHPRFGPIIKMVDGVTDDGLYRLSGTSPASTSREDLGLIQPQDMIARLVLRISPGAIKPISNLKDQ